MNISSKKEALFLLVGDVFILLISLWLTLFIRYRRFPFESLWLEHFAPFATIGIIWILVFFISGLYEKHTQILTKKLPEMILNTQIINAVIGFLYFYISPDVKIAPKINLILYVLISTGLVYLWRRNAQRFINSHKKELAILIGKGEIAEGLLREVNNNPRYRMQFAAVIDPTLSDQQGTHQKVINTIFENNVKVVVLDMHDRSKDTVMAHFANLMFSDVRFIDLTQIYEEIFDKIPSSLLTYHWFLEHVSKPPMRGYVSFKRAFDVVASIAGGILVLPFLPFIAAGIKFSSPGPILFKQIRVGERNRPITIPKFRTMDICEQGEDALHSKAKVTRFGALLRISRLDELPQLWSVIKGDLSLIGPRPEIPEIAAEYERTIPYYSMRHLIRPGLSGWAQLYGEHGHHGVSIPETIDKLSYDLFYLKNRSFIMDLKIALKTIKRIITRSGK